MELKQKLFQWIQRTRAYAVYKAKLTRQILLFLAIYFIIFYFFTAGPLVMALGFIFSISAGYLYFKNE